MHKYVTEYIQALKFGDLVCIAGMLTELIYLRYAAGIAPVTFQDHYFLYLFVFSSAFFIQRTFRRDPWFLIILLIAPGLFACRVMYNTYLLPFIFLIWLAKDRDQVLYGISATLNFKPYFLMLVLMVPVIYLASRQDDFIKYYPVVKNLSIAGEVDYMFNFITIEFFFRGFLVVSLGRMVGPACIIPVACFYCVIHFNKPLPEVVSSFFGGVLLGIVTYKTRSVWGGLLVHLGIGLMMEAAGYCSNNIY